MPDNDERIAVLETLVEEQGDKLVKINDKLDVLLENMNKMKGFWAGAIAAGTALGAALSYLVSYIFQTKVG